MKLSIRNSKKYIWATASITVILFSAFLIKNLMHRKPFTSLYDAIEALKWNQYARHIDRACYAFLFLFSLFGILIPMVIVKTRKRKRNKTH